MEAADWGDVVIAGAAVIGAIVAASVAVWRMRRELAHDRKMRRAEALRDLLDQSVTGLAEVADVVGRLYPEAKEFSGRVFPNQTFEKDLDEARDKVLALGNDFQRLRLRFTNFPHVPNIYWEARDALEKALVPLGDGRVGPSTEYLLISRQWYVHSAKLTAQFSTAAAKYVAV